MTFPDAVRTCLSKYVTFSGRATRSEFWFFALFSFLAFVSASIFDGLLNLVVPAPAMGGYMLSSIVALGLMLPQISAAVRRLHDLGHSGWWYLIGLIPVAGGLVLLVLFCFEGTPSENRFGSNPLAFESDWAPENT
jgi:uncharacterized membrane protein YhaH (DUF805 family)